MPFMMDPLFHVQELEMVFFPLEEIDNRSFVAGLGHFLWIICL